MANPPQNFFDYRDALAERMCAISVRESATTLDIEAPNRTDERLAQCIWFDSLFVHGGLRTESGKPLEVLQPGRWNQGAGPDFRDAKVRIDGKTLRGDVEVHLWPEGWRQHRHHLDSNYDSVVLHACLWPSPGKRTPSRTALGGRIECFVMEPALFPDLDTIRQTLRVEDYPYQTPSAAGRCQPLMCSLGEDYVGGFLDAAGRERLEAKARRFESQAAGETLDQVFYQAILSAMGHKANKGLFFLLSKRAPLADLTDYLRDRLGATCASRDEARGPSAQRFFEAILLHVSRLAPDATPENADAEMSAYLEDIRALWAPFAGYFADRLIPPTGQWIAGVRPVNFAHRRIAGVAHLLARWFLGAGIAEAFGPKVESFDRALAPRQRVKWIRRELIDGFVVEGAGDFWAWRYNFNSRRAEGAMKLIGASRAASIALNALLPLLLLSARRSGNARLEAGVWEVFSAFPPLESNSMVRHMRARLFAGDARADALLNTEARQQGLFQIFADCCAQNESGCEDCFYAKLGGQNGSRLDV